MTAGVALAMCALVGAAGAAGPAITEFGAGITESAGPLGITRGSDGALWFTEASGRIGRITPKGTVVEFSAGISNDSFPDGIAAGPDGNVWFTENGTARIGRITAGGAITEFRTGITSGSGPAAIVAGPDGNLWFTEEAGAIGKITRTGVVTEYRNGLTRSKDPDLPALGDIVAGRDGRLWFTEPGSDGIGAITTHGIVTEFHSGITADSHPNGIAEAPDGKIWFTEPDADQIGRIAVGAGGGRKVTVTLVVAGKGTVTGVGATCSTRCAVTVAPGARLVFRATPARGSRFVGWTGPCAGRGSCTMRTAVSLTLRATFRRR